MSISKKDFVHKVDILKEKLYRVAYTYLRDEGLALEVLDEALFQAYVKRKTLREEKYFDTWITRIVINECYQELRRRKRIEVSHEVEEKIDEQESPDYYDQFLLKEAMEHLPEELRSIIQLRYLCGYTVVETAQILQLPQGTIATRTRKALSLLRIQLEE